jgi:hypothetical protein
VLLILGVAAALVIASSVSFVLAATTIVHTGHSVTLVKVLSDASSQDIGGTTWQDLPGAATSVTVPANSSAVVLARFTSATTCGGQTGQPCLVRILVGGQEADPALGDRSYIDYVHGPPQAVQGDNVPEAHSVERSLGPLPSGVYRVTVQYKTGAGAGLHLDGWNLTVERIRS